MSGQTERVPGEINLELLDFETEPLAKAERVALEFHADCIEALNGYQLSAGNFVLTPEFRAIKQTLRSKVGQVMADRIMSD